MRAAIYNETGPAAETLRIAELPIPEPGNGEVLVKVYASGINPTDTRTRAGIFPIAGEWQRIVPHHDGAGVIESVGANVSTQRIGQRVWLHSSQWAGADGTAADYVIASEKNAVELPDNIGFDAGATFGVPLITAYHAVMLDGPVQGKTLLIQGGAGAVGNYAIQIARHMGATVITTVSSDAKGDAARETGADHVINYRSEDLAQRVQDITNGAGVDHIIEVNLSANALQLPGLLKNGGFVTVYGTEAFTAEFPAVGAVVQQMRFGFFVVFALPSDVLEATTQALTELLASGGITSLIPARMPLERIAEAHDLLDSGTSIGNVVLSLVD